MKTVKMHMNTNARIVSKVLTRNKNTFYALKELINNSIQAYATCIRINLIPSDKNCDDWQYKSIERIQIIDNGKGVPFSKFRKSLLELATDNKPNGFGVGRFSGLQIGCNMQISTVGYEEEQKRFTRTNVEFDISQFEKEDLTSIDFNVNHEIISESSVCGYNVEIYNLYSNQERCSPRNKLGTEFLSENIRFKLFEHYPLYIFEEKIQFIVNGHKLKRADFVNTPPKLQEVIFTDSFGNGHKIRLQYFSLKLKDPKVRLFIQCYNGEVQSTALELTYNSMWYSPSMGTQYILIESEYLTRDFIDNCVLGELNNDWKNFAHFLKTRIDEFYKKNNSKYATFIMKLKADKYYPYTPKESLSETLSSSFFDQSAFIIEEDLELLSKNESHRALVYLLLRKVIDDGNLSFIINHVIALSKTSQSRLIDLLDKTNLEKVINFSALIASRLQTLELLEKIALSETEKHLDLYKKISKTIFKNPWLMGDEYINSIPAQPQQNIIEILEDLFAKFIPQKATKKNNVISGCKSCIKKLISQIIYNERRLDYDKKEISVIVIFAPAIKISQYETSCIDRYLYALGNNNGYSKNNTLFKIYFIASQLDDFARQKINKHDSEHFIYPNMNSGNDKIRSYLMDWASLIEYNREKLSCAGETLKRNRIDVETAFLQEYPDLLEGKNTAQLRIIK
jgi:hypothetical protein